MNLYKPTIQKDYLEKAGGKKLLLYLYYNAIFVDTPFVFI